MRLSRTGSIRALLSIVACMFLWTSCGESPTAPSDPGPIDPEAILREEMARGGLTTSWYRGCIWQNFRLHLPTYQGKSLQFILADIRAIIAVCLEEEPPAEGSLEATTSTSGDDLDPNGYTLSVDGGTAQAIGTNAVVTVPGLAPGDHDVLLSDVASNCSVAGDNPRTVAVAAGVTAETTFAITCAETEGALDVVTETSGQDLDPDGYTVSVGGGAATPTGITDTLTFADLTPGDHAVALADVAANCTVGGANPRTVAVTAGVTSETTFAVTCTAIVVPPDQIVFTRFTSGLWILDDDGSNATQLTTVGSDQNPDVSPDGSKIVFASFDGGSELDIFTTNIDGTNRTQLTDASVVGGQSFDPEFSPNGSQIVFHSTRPSDGAIQIWVMDADGSNPVQLTSTGSNGYASWSPDGNRIVFASNRDGNFEIYVMDSDGGNQARLTNAAGSDFDPAFSPDGMRIVHDTNRNGAYDIYVMDDDGANPVQLTTDSGDDFYPAWSPDGQFIAFSSNRDGSVTVWVMGADGSSQTDLSLVGPDFYATWVP